MRGEPHRIRRPIPTFVIVPLQLTIAHVNAADEARRLRDTGYCPVECSFAEESVVDELLMDHHGSLSHLEGVAVRAYRDHYGARRSDPRFVVTGAADADATFAIAALAGLLPHPNLAKGTVGGASNALSQDLLPLAELINKADLTPTNLGLEACPEGRLLLLFKQLASGQQDGVAFYSGVDRWRLLCGPRAPRALLEAVTLEERRRVEQARAATVELLNDVVAFVESPVWGYDVWYAEVRPVMVAYVAAQGSVSIGCRDLATAERHFGAGGLRNVFGKLQPPGWGGRETVGGSPRGLRLDREQARVAAVAVAAMAVQRP